MARRLRPGQGIFAAAIVGLIIWLSIFGLVKAAHGQDSASTKPQQFLVYVDTAGIAPVAPNVFTTWVYAFATPTSYPSSGVLVEWDCENGKVRRTAQVKFAMKADSTGVSGQVEMVNGEWVDPVDPRLYRIVCDVGPTHVPAEAPPPMPSTRLSAVDKPRINA